MYTLWDLFVDHSIFLWDINSISQNPNITWENICEYPNLRWNWYYISRNPNITWEIIRDNPDKPWKWDGVSQNPNITPEIINNNMNHDWNWHELVRNPMDQPYYRSEHHKKKLAKELIDAVFDELMMVVCHPQRHPANYMATCDLVDHPLNSVTQTELRQL